MYNCPNNYTDDHCLFQKHDIQPEEKYKDKFFEIELDIDLDELTSDCITAFDEFGWIGFANIFSPVMERSNFYGGLSLVWNPNYAYELEDKHAHTLGYPRLAMPKGFYSNMDIWRKLIDHKLDKKYYSVLAKEGYEDSLLWLYDNNILSRKELTKFIEMAEYETHETDKIPLKNTYSDTYSFNRLTPVAKYKSIGKITEKFKRQIVRSRLASLNINAGQKQTDNRLKQYLWHRDGSWFKEFRFNISVTAELNNHTIQLHSDNGPAYTYVPGRAYVWDTDIAHVHYSKKPSDFYRINLIYAVSPWFDYNSEKDIWYPNEFCEKKHPIDMLLDGDIIDMNFKNVHIH